MKTMKAIELEAQIKDVFRRIAEYQIRKKKSLFWVRLYYSLTKGKEES